MNHSHHFEFRFSPFHSFENTENDVKMVVIFFDKENLLFDDVCTVWTSWGENARNVDGRRSTMILSTYSLLHSFRLAIKKTAIIGYYSRLKKNESHISSTDFFFFLYSTVWPLDRNIETHSQFSFEIFFLLFATDTANNAYCYESYNIIWMSHERVATHQRRKYTASE